jgi:hypothetical protein
VTLDPEYGRGVIDDSSNGVLGLSTVSSHCGAQLHDGQANIPATLEQPISQLSDATIGTDVSNDDTSASSTIAVDDSPRKQKLDLVKKLFSGTMESVLHCTNCGHCSYKSEIFLDLGLHIARSFSLSGSPDSTGFPSADINGNHQGIGNGQTDLANLEEVPQEMTVNANRLGVSDDVDVVGEDTQESQSSRRCHLTALESLQTLGAMQPSMETLSSVCVDGKMSVVETDTESPSTPSTLGVGGEVMNVAGMCDSQNNVVLSHSQTLEKTVGPKVADGGEDVGGLQSPIVGKPGNPGAHESIESCLWSFTAKEILSMPVVSARLFPKVRYGFCIYCGNDLR